MLCGIASDEMIYMDLRCLQIDDERERDKESNELSIQCATASGEVNQNNQHSSLQTNVPRSMGLNNRGGMLGGEGDLLIRKQPPAICEKDSWAIRPTSIRELCFKTDKWNFELQYLRDKTLREEYATMNGLPERIWFIKSTIRVKTWISQRTKPVKNGAMPPGLMLVRNPAPALLKGAREEMIRLFDDQLKTKPKSRLPYSDYRKSRGLYYIFGTDLKLKRFVPYGEALPMLEGYPDLRKFCEAYGTFLCESLNISAEVFKTEVMLLLLMYDEGFGLWLHVDNVARTNGSPICTVSLGPPDVNVDFVPVLKPTRSRIPLRLNCNEGDMLMMQGEARYEWAHGIPYGLPTKKYTLMFKFNQIKGISVATGYSKLIDATFYETPFKPQCTTFVV